MGGELRSDGDDGVFLAKTGILLSDGCFTGDLFMAELDIGDGGGADRKGRETGRLLGLGAQLKEEKKN